MSSSTLEISDEDWLTLESWTRSPTLPAGHVERARIVLAVAEGAGTPVRPRRPGVSQQTVTKWRNRFAAHGFAALDDEPRSGRLERIDEAVIIAATLP